MVLLITRWGMLKSCGWWLVAHRRPLVGLRMQLVAYRWLLVIHRRRLIAHERTLVLWIGLFVVCRLLIVLINARTVCS